MSLENTKLLITPNGYKAGKLYSALPESGAGDSTFARATTATRVNAEGLIEEVGLNVPRVDYPVLGGCPSLLLEPQRTNLLLNSEFSGAISGTPGTSPTSFVNIQNTGQLTVLSNPIGNKLQFTTNGTNARAIQQSVSVLANTTYVYSLKADILIQNRLDFYINVGLPVGATAQFRYNGTNVANTFQVPVGACNLQILITNSINIGSLIIRLGSGIFGNTNGNIIFKEPQLEQASTASSYIPTLASAVTRNTDILINDITSLVDSTYTALLDVSASDSRLKIEDGTTGFDLPLNGTGRIVMVVDSNITFYFPDNGQATTVLTYAKPSDLRNIDVLSKINETKIKVIAVENGVALQSRIDSWVSGNVSSYFIDTDWGLETSFLNEFRESDWDYFPLINTSNGTSFIAAWRNNNLTSFPLIDTNNGTNFEAAWLFNNLTSFPKLNTDNGSNFFATWQGNNLTTWLPNYFDTCVGTNFDRAWESNAIDQTGVDNILVSINTARLAGVQTGITKVIGINLGTNATPSATGQAATDELRADGWTVNLNGY